MINKNPNNGVVIYFKTKKNLSFNGSLILHKFKKSSLPGPQIKNKGCIIPTKISPKLVIES